MTFLHRYLAPIHAFYVNAFSIVGAHRLTCLVSRLEYRRKDIIAHRVGRSFDLFTAPVSLSCC